MTYIYQWGGMPREIEIACPLCQKKAVFQFARMIPIARKAHIPFFEKSPHFEYFHNKNGYSRHLVIYQPAIFAELDKNKIATLGEIAPLYQSPLIWISDSMGAYHCFSCHSKKPHHLNWQKDAFYKTDIRGHLFWAYDKEHLLAIRDFIYSKERKEKNHAYAISLYHLPTFFKQKKMREPMLKIIDKMLLM